MADLSKPWPATRGTARWWLIVGGGVVLFCLALTVDRSISLWAQGWPTPIRDALTEITPYGESDWILYPSAALFVVTAAVAQLQRRKLTRLMLWQFAGLFAFIFAGVGLPSLISTVAKRVIGRGRPVHLEDGGTLSFHPNWAEYTYQSLPSGHATTAFALAVVVGFCSERWFYPALALAATIGVSRIALGEHYPSDVIAGAMLGLMGAYLVRSMFAQRRWTFEADSSGHIHMRALSSLKRYLALTRRGSAPGPLKGQP